jgi:tetratricopeptide (TPR) repeat protein
MKRSVLLIGAAICVSMQLASAQSVDHAQLYAERYAAGNYSEAVESAKLLVTEVIAQGDDSIAYADALERLADAQRMLGDLPAAVQNYRSALGRIESGADMLTYRLVTPLVGLARTFEQGQEYGAAVAEYQRAAHITRVNEGPMNLPQCEILSALVNIYAHQERFDEARDVQEFLLYVYRRSLAETDPRVIEAWRRNGELLSLSGKHQQAQELYTFAADIIRVADGQNSLAQIDLLNDLSNSYLEYASADRFTRVEMARAQLDRIVTITESNPDASILQRTNAYLRMGDLMQLFGDWNSALNFYRSAWQQLHEDDTLRQDTFGMPVLLNPPPSISLPDDVAEPVPVAITVAYDIDQRGHVDNPRVPDESSHEAAAKKALLLTRKLIFRPRFESGDPVDTLDLVREIPIIE